MAKKKRKPLTREDVLKAIEENGGTAEGLDLSGRKFEDGIDLRGLDLSAVILKEAILWDITLEDPDRRDPTRGIKGAHLEGAKLINAHLEGAHILGSHLEGADLFNAHLEGALLTEVHLEGADLSIAHLEGAKLRASHFEGARLAGVKLSPETLLEEVDWGNYILDEERVALFDIAAETYRKLKMWHTNVGMYDTAAKFYYREKEANRKSLKLCSKNWHNRLAAEFMRAFFGYGERWERILIWMAVVVFGFAAAYHFWGSFSSSSFSDTLYYSAASFTALGYGRWAPQPTGWAKITGAAEAFIGVSMMALLLVTFVRKWTR